MSERPLHLKINTQHLFHNFKVAKQYAKNAKIYAVIKANAYGVGDHLVFSVLKNEADGFALLELEKALFFRKATPKPLLLLEGVFSQEETRLAAENNIIFVCHNEEQLHWAKKAYLKNPFLSVVLKLNTGMNRLGFTLKKLSKALNFIKEMPNARWGLMAHFARADEENGVEDSFLLFQKMRQVLVENAPFLKNAPVSLANSAAILSAPKTHAEAVRPGIMLYGASPFGEKKGASDFNLKPVMNLYSSIIAVQHLEKGDSVGYGGVFRAEKPMRVGVVACGYADGYPRQTANAPLCVAGVLTQTLGRVSMDMLTCDLTSIPEAGVGAWVTLLGEDPSGIVIPAEKVAQSAHTIAYEIFSLITPRVRRI